MSLTPERQFDPKTLARASVRGNEYGWSLSDFPEVLREAESLGLACLGGQFQFRLPDGTCEMYWLNADASARSATESWEQYVARSCKEVADNFDSLVRATDFVREAQSFAFLKARSLRTIEQLMPFLFFVAYFEEERSDFASPSEKWSMQPMARASTLALV